MDPVHPDLAIVIVTYNSEHVIADLLDSLPPALNGLRADVVVVDNGSVDGTATLAEKRDDCRVVRSANTGYAGGINRGVREAAPADAILVLNPDVRLHEDSIRPLLTALAEPAVGIAVPQLRSATGALEFSLRREPTLLRALGLSKTGIAAFSEAISAPVAYAQARQVDWAQGAVVLMSRDCLDAVRGWDESYFLYSEETDLSLRARDAGFLTRYEPRSVAVHIGGQSGRTKFTHAMQVVNRVRLYRRRHGVLASWCYYVLVIGGELKRALRGSSASRFAVAALVRPSLRPEQLGCSGRLLPR